MMVLCLHAAGTLTLDALVRLFPDHTTEWFKQNLLASYQMDRQKLAHSPLSSQSTWKGGAFADYTSYKHLLLLVGPLDNSLKNRGFPIFLIKFRVTSFPLLHSPFRQRIS